MAVEVKTNPGWQPDWAVMPGEILAETLGDRGMSQVELARRTGRPVKAINEVVKGHAAITPDTALQLESVLAVPARFWLNLQRDYDEAKARLRERERMLAYSPWAARFPFAAMTKHHLVEPTRARGEKIQALLRFFAVSTPDAWRQQWLEPRASFRRSPTYASRSEALSVWLRWGEREAIANTVPAFDARKLREALASLRSLTLMHPLALRQQLTEILAECGVILVLIPELPGTRVVGGTFWTGANPVVQLSLRHKSDDQFWFALFHELAHVLVGERRNVYLDLVIQTTDQEEVAANDFARDTLIPADRYAQLRGAHLTAKVIKDFARAAGITPGIVVGRLEFDKLVSPGRFSYLKQRFDWAKLARG